MRNSNRVILDTEMGGDATTISAVHPDIIQTHILTRLDGPTLASAGCASSELRTLSTEENLWRDICNQTWPSTADPRVRHLISTFPAGHRSFYSDSFPALDHRRPSKPNPHRPPPPSKLISAVDIHYQNRLVLSKVHETEILTGLLLSSPFQVDLLNPKEAVPMPVKLDIRDDMCQVNLEEGLTLSWILIDPNRNRAATISSLRPVSVDRNWSTGDIELRFMTLFAGDRRGEWVQCGVVVTCGGTEGEGVHLREVRLHVEDMKGKNLTWKESLVILQEAVEGGKRRKQKRGEERERYEECLNMKRERRKREQMREKRLELVYIATVVTIFVAFWVFVIGRFFQLL